MPSAPGTMEVGRVPGLKCRANSFVPYIHRERPVLAIWSNGRHPGVYARERSRRCPIPENGRLRGSMNGTPRTGGQSSPQHQSACETQNSRDPAHAEMNTLPSSDGFRKLLGRRARCAAALRCRTLARVIEVMGATVGSTSRVKRRGNDSGNRSGSRCIGSAWNQARCRSLQTRRDSRQRSRKS